MQRLARRTAIALVVVAAFADTAAAHSERPDLVVTRVSNPPSAVTTGGAFRVSDRVVNRGDALAGRSTTRYFIARSAAGRIFDEKGIVLRGSTSVEALDPGRSLKSTRLVEIPDVPAGTYDLVACADARNRVRETGDGNNCRSAARGMRVDDNARDAVFIGGGAATGAFTEDVRALLAPGLTLSGLRDTVLTGATAAIGAGGAGTYALTGDSGRDWFFFANQSAITGTYNSGTGVLTLTGRATVAEYEGALRSIWYQHRGDDPRGTRQVEFRVRSARGAYSRPGHMSLTVTPVNDPPQLAVLDMEVPFDVGVLDPDGDIAGATVRLLNHGAGDDLAFTTMRGITGTYDSGTGVLTLTGTAPGGDYSAALRSIRVTRRPDASGPRSFEIQVTDAGGATSNILPYVEQQP